MSRHGIVHFYCAFLSAHAVGLRTAQHTRRVVIRISSQQMCGVCAKPPVQREFNHRGHKEHRAGKEKNNLKFESEELRVKEKEEE